MSVCGCRTAVFLTRRTRWQAGSDQRQLARVLRFAFFLQRQTAAQAELPTAKGLVADPHSSGRVQSAAKVKCLPEQRQTEISRRLRGEVPVDLLDAPRSPPPAAPSEEIEVVIETTERAEGPPGSGDPG